MAEPLAATTGGIVGSWILDTADSRVVFSFLPDGRLMIADKHTPATPDGASSGLEAGTYSWDATTGAFSFSLTTNTDGDAGLSDAGVNNITISGDTLTLHSLTEGNYSLERLYSPPNSLIGSWYGAPTDGGSDLVVFTFLADGTYFLADHGSHAADPTGDSGIEWGTFQWTQQTGQFSFQTKIDTDGEWGLSHTNGQLTEAQVIGDALWVGNQTKVEGVGTRLTPVGTPAPATITGTPNADQLSGTSGNDTVLALDGKDTITGAGGNDAIDGGGGIDTAMYSGLRSAYAIARTDTGFSVGGGSDGSDTLTSVERLHFSNLSVALDVDGAAGNVARIIGAVFGASSLSIKEYVGIGLSYLDSGMSYQALMELAINFKLGGSAGSHAAVVNLLYGNVIGGAPAADQLAQYVGMLDSGSQTSGSLGVLAAALPQNEAHINLTGLAQAGIEFV